MINHQPLLASRFVTITITSWDAYEGNYETLGL